MRTEVLLRYANGYRILEMFEDAERELDKIHPEERSADGPLSLRVALFQDSECWDEMREAAALLRDRHPKEVSWWIADAYATRRCRSIEEAREVLLAGVENHPEEPCMQYNLGCYACVLGERAEAISRVRSAIALNDDYAKMALTDDDLEAIRDELL